MSGRIRLRNAPKGDAIEKAIKKAEDAGYKKGFKEATNLHEKLSAEEVNKSNSIAIETQKAYVKASDELSKMTSGRKSDNARKDKYISDLREQLCTVGEQNRDLKDRLVDRNREITKIRQTKASSVTGTMSRRKRRTNRSMRHRMKEEDDKFYG